MEDKDNDAIIKNSVFNSNCTYEIYNYNSLVLENNTLSKFIYNTGKILSKTNIIMLNNSTLEISLNNPINVTTVITDDNGNVIIQDSNLNFTLNGESLGEGTADANGTYCINTKFNTTGKYTISANNLGRMENLTIFNATVLVRTDANRI